MSTPKAKEPATEVPEVATVKAVTVEELSARIDKLIAEKRAEATAVPAGTDNTKANAWLNEIVTIEIFGDGKRYSGDVYVSVNNTHMLVQRNKRVKVPRFIANALEQSHKQEIKLSELKNSKASEYEEASKIGRL